MQWTGENNATPLTTWPSKTFAPDSVFCQLVKADAANTCRIVFSQIPLQLRRYLPCHTPAGERQATGKIMATSWTSDDSCGSALMFYRVRHICQWNCAKCSTKMSLRNPFRNQPGFGGHLKSSRVLAFLSWCTVASFCCPAVILRNKLLAHLNVVFCRNQPRHAGCYQHKKHFRHQTLPPPFPASLLATNGTRFADTIRPLIRRVRLRPHSDSLSAGYDYPQQFLYLFPLPQGQSSLRPVLDELTGSGGWSSFMRSDMFSGFSGSNPMINFHPYCSKISATSFARSKSWTCTIAGFFSVPNFAIIDNTSLCVIEKSCKIHLLLEKQKRKY